MELTPVWNEVAEGRVFGQWPFWWWISSNVNGFLVFGAIEELLRTYRAFLDPERPFWRATRSFCWTKLTLGELTELFLTQKELLKTYRGFSWPKKSFSRSNGSILDAERSFLDLTEPSLTLKKLFKGLKEPS